MTALKHVSIAAILPVFDEKRRFGRGLFYRLGSHPLFYLSQLANKNTSDHVNANPATKNAGHTRKKRKFGCPWTLSFQEASLLSPIIAVERIHNALSMLSRFLNSKFFIQPRLNNSVVLNVDDH